MNFSPSKGVFFEYSKRLIRLSDIRKQCLNFKLSLFRMLRGKTSVSFVITTKIVLIADEAEGETIHLQSHL